MMQNSIQDITERIKDGLTSDLIVRLTYFAISLTRKMYWHGHRGGTNMPKGETAESLVSLAVEKLLSGQNSWPQGISLYAVLIRNLRREVYHLAESRENRTSLLSLDDQGADIGIHQYTCTALQEPSTPASDVIAQEEARAWQDLFQQFSDVLSDRDPKLVIIFDLMCEGRKSGEIADELGLEAKRIYNAQRFVQRNLRRKILEASQDNPILMETAKRAGISILSEGARRMAANSLDQLIKRIPLNIVSHQVRGAGLDPEELERRIRGRLARAIQTKVPPDFEISEKLARSIMEDLEGRLVYSESDGEVLAAIPDEDERGPSPEELREWVGSRIKELVDMIAVQNKLMGQPGDQAICSSTDFETDLKDLITSDLGLDLSNPSHKRRLSELATEFFGSVSRNNLLKRHFGLQKRGNELRLRSHQVTPKKRNAVQAERAKPIKTETARKLPARKRLQTVKVCGKQVYIANLSGKTSRGRMVEILGRFGPVRFAQSSAQPRSGVFSFVKPEQARRAATFIRQESAKGRWVGKVSGTAEANSAKRKARA